MKTSCRGALGALLMIVSVLGLVASGAPAQAGSQVDGGLLGKVSSTRWFSPDNNGAKDTVRVGIRVQERARVSITVRHERKGWVARRVSLGSVKAGRRVWTWDGRNDRGRVVQDGSYVVTVVAARGARRDRATTRIESRRDYAVSRDNLPVLTVDRDTVPAGGTVTIIAYQRVEDRSAFGRDGSYPIFNALTIYSDGGGSAVVAAYPMVRDISEPVRTWTASAPTGEPLPPGSYTLVSHVVDDYGNNGTLARRLTVTAAGAS